MQRLGEISQEVWRDFESILQDDQVIFVFEQLERPRDGIV